MRFVSAVWRTVVLVILCSVLSPRSAFAAAPVIALQRDDAGDKLVIDGHDFMVKGVVWGYSPIGTNYSYSLWKQPDAFIKRVLADQMPRMQRMGINAIRNFDPTPPRWIRYVYETYGIYNIIDNMMGRYGVTRDGVWIPHVNYADPDMRAYLLGELDKQVNQYKGTPGLLMWMLGNENNYGLTWTSAEAEALPAKQDDQRAGALYSLMSEAAQHIKKAEPNRVVALVNGDLQYIDVIAKNTAGFDIFGTNQYRGPRAGKLFEDVKQKLHLPVVFTEFGSDAFNTRTGKEDGLSQAKVLRSQWQEIYEQSYGKGFVANSLGGFIFQWQDDWWKVGQDYDLEVHNTTATWPDAAYYDFVEGENNMNEEWWGLNAIDPPDDTGFTNVRPRATYFMLKDVLHYDPYAPDVHVAQIRTYFAQIHAEDYEAPADAKLALEGGTDPIRVSRFLLKLETTSSAGTHNTLRGDHATFDHFESAYVDVTLQPSSKLSARLSLNFTAHAAANRLDPLYYENIVPPAHPYVPPTANGVPAASASTTVPPVSIYQAEINAEHRWFNLQAYYRVGHPGWDYEGDLFHLYPEAFYQQAVDIYRATAPFGAVISGRRGFDGLKVAFGPAVYWGANPTIIGKYRKELGPVAITAMHQEDIASARDLAGTTATSSVIPGPITRRSTLGLSTDIGDAHLDVGGLFAGSQRVGDQYTRTEKTAGPGYAGSGYNVFQDKIGWKDTFGGKAKLTYATGPAAFYLEGVAKGLVTDAGPDTSLTITGWTLKESGRGNQLAAMAGTAITLGSIQIAPNVLVQRPLVGPNPNIAGSFDGATQTLIRPVRARNQVDDPFVVLDNRETEAGELLLTYDPTPDTRFYQWDRVNREDAPFAGSLDFVYRHQPTSRDSRMGILNTGQQFAFGGAPPAHDVWDLTGAWSANAAKPLGLSGTLYFGQNQATGTDARLVTRYGASLRASFADFVFATRVALNDWGPYDYYRDFNLTYPFQWYGDMSWGPTRGLFGVEQTRFGVRGQYRTMDQHSAGWLYDLNPGLRAGEWEVTTYVHAAL